MNIYTVVLKKNLKNYSEFGSDRRQNLHYFIQVEKLEIDKLNTMKPSRKTKQNNKTKQKWKKKWIERNGSERTGLTWIIRRCTSTRKLISIVLQADRKSTLINRTNNAFRACLKFRKEGEIYPYFLVNDCLLRDT